MHVLHPTSGQRRSLSLCTPECIGGGRGAGVTGARMGMANMTFVVHVLSPPLSVLEDHSGTLPRERCVLGIGLS